MKIEDNIFTVVGKRFKPASPAFLASLTKEPMIERKTHKDIKLAQFLHQNLSPLNDFSESVFTESQNVIDKLKMEETLEDLAEKRGFHSIMDFVFCSLYPDKEKECRKYYRDKGKQLSHKYSENQIREWDNIMAQALFFFYKEHQKEMNNTKNELV